MTRIYKPGFYYTAHWEVSDDGRSYAILADGVDGYALLLIPSDVCLRRVLQGTPPVPGRPFPVREWRIHEESRNAHGRPDVCFGEAAGLYNDRYSIAVVRHA